MLLSGVYYDAFEYEQILVKTSMILLTSTNIATSQTLFTLQSAKFQFHNPQKEPLVTDAKKIVSFLTQSVQLHKTK